MDDFETRAFGGRPMLRPHNMVSSWQNVVEIRLKYGLLQSTTIASDISRTWSSSTMGRRPTLGLGGLKRLNAVARLSLAVRHQARPSPLLKTADFQVSIAPTRRISSIPNHLSGSSTIWTVDQVTD
ncbi:uncharacterized protein CCOS01_05633 [Colletotrichum costaricense]|uniref:Uncharacterized protein n=2 Tax=Colletotrichum acutatum species complex TaxID=2707335 RepID=A0AAI9Z0Z7_9PEZI|nr:uncharacterized protein CCOS01_05633 [Colletotrichum costaricense]XP_060388451.1 uncharacterized protein CTAM01_00945 [Colletotrichum tamarilloi]KAK1512015.1 hypothetical protein CTAM01_00945 [Colletotrichum tamarilloi]KAK1530530.1 hypothetical protein CCOS01_05633 [Colletotrichum costaricense]